MRVHGVTWGVWIPDDIGVWVVDIAGVDSHGGLDWHVSIESCVDILPLVGVDWIPIGIL